MLQLFVGLCVYLFSHSLYLEFHNECIFQFLTMDSSCVDSSCLTDYEPCALVATNNSSISSPFQPFLFAFLLNSWNHTAGVHSEKLELEQSKYDIPGVHSEKLKNVLTVELQL